VVEHLPEEDRKERLKSKMPVWIPTLTTMLLALIGRERGRRGGKGREGKGREGKGREGKGREGKGREGKGREGKGKGRREKNSTNRNH
jgi:hypothetical protein